MSRLFSLVFLSLLLAANTAVQAQDTFCWRDHGSRGPGQPLDSATGQCGEGLEWTGSLCYPTCEGKAEGIGEFCWGRCPSSMPFDCGAACAATPDDCTAEIQEMLVQGARMAVDVVPFGGSTPNEVNAAISNTAEALVQGAANSPASNATSRVKIAGIRETVKAALQELLVPTSGVLANIDASDAGSLAGLLQEVNAQVDGGLTGGHTLALLSTQMTDEQLDALITGLTLIFVDEKVANPRNALTSLPVTNPFTTLNFVDTFRHANCSGYPDGGIVPEYLSVSANESDNHLNPPLGYARDALGMLISSLPEPAGNSVIRYVKETLNQGNIRDVLGPEASPELLHEIMARFEEGQLLEGNELLGSARDLPPPKNEFEALFLCMARYSKEGQCDWGHWSEMYEVCELYKYPKLSDPETIAAVKADKCQWSNWSPFAEWLHNR